MAGNAVKTDMLGFINQRVIIDFIAMVNAEIV